MKYWWVVPAAGEGARFDATLPKQYFPILGTTVIEHCLQRLLSFPGETIVVALNKYDARWQNLAIFNGPRIRVAEGGAQRADSVLNALIALAAEAEDQDWVLVHDVVRPCITRSDVQRLMTTLAKSSVGGLLASPVNATLKRIEEFSGLTQDKGDGVVSETVDRGHLWLAATPQMFRYRPLIEALSHCREQELAVSDEAAAMELSGHRPIIISGRTDNIKITHRADLALAEAILQAQCSSGENIVGQQDISQ